MNVVCLAVKDRRLLRARWNEYDNSHARMHAALLSLGADDDSARLNGLRDIEKKFDLDLAEICHRHACRNHAGTHPIERLVLEFITDESHGEAAQLWVLPDRVKQVRQLMEGRFAAGVAPAPADDDDVEPAR